MAGVWLCTKCNWFLVIELQLALDLTKCQETDITHLRKLFYYKLGALSSQRQELPQQVPNGPIESSSQASARLAEIMSIAQQLQDNTAAELRPFTHFFCCLPPRGTRFLRSCIPQTMILNTVCHSVWQYRALQKGLCL